MNKQEKEELIDWCITGSNFKKAILKHPELLTSRYGGKTLFLNIKNENDRKFVNLLFRKLKAAIAYNYPQNSYLDYDLIDIDIIDNYPRVIVNYVLLSPLICNTHRYENAITFETFINILKDDLSSSRL